MSTVIARRLASTPRRSAAQTWQKIIEILAPNPHSAARLELMKASGVACASISSEATKDAPIVVWGHGPRVRIYCVFDEDSVTQDAINEDALPQTPTDGNWHMSIPCLPEDVKWSTDRLLSISRVSARSVDEEVEGERSKTLTSAVMTINPAELFKS